MCAYTQSLCCAFSYRQGGVCVCIFFPDRRSAVVQSGRQGGVCVYACAYFSLTGDLRSGRQGGVCVCVCISL